jgi:hypothetical protein
MQSNLFAGGAIGLNGLSKVVHQMSMSLKALMIPSLPPTVTLQQGPIKPMVTWDYEMAVS